MTKTTTTAVINRKEQDHNSNETSKEIIEEDWSHLFQTTASNSSGYATHKAIEIPLSATNNSEENRKSLTLKLFCVDALTPMDMMDLWEGSSDATGNKVWMGAFFFLAAFVYSLSDDEIGNIPSEVSDQDKENCKYPIQASELLEYRRLFFHEKKILELGAGTGASGISILMKGGAGKDNDVNININTRQKRDYISDGLSPTYNEHDSDEYSKMVKPSSVVFTDSDESVLSLCQKNCEANLNEAQEYKVCKLDWGETHQDCDLHGFKRKHCYDTIIATDVLYDLTSLTPLIRTAATHIKLGGYFILSHVPRASLGDGRIGTAQELERLIYLEARKYGFELMDLKGKDSCYNDIGNSDCKTNLPAIRPNDLLQIKKEVKEDLMALSTWKCQEMESAGAAALAFISTCSYSSYENE